jgi:DNA repair photolyase
MTTRHHKGRGAVSDREGRFATRPVEFEPEEAHHRAQESPETVVRSMRTGRIIATNSSPDVPFDRSINPYQGCEHGCVYCYARPSHSYLDLSPGLDFETKIFYKPDAAARLADEWEKSGYTCEPITIGANTEPYQPAERSTRITRELLELFDTHSHPVSLITKSNLIVRDLDIFERLAKRNLCSVAISIPTMDAALKRILEPRIPSASARLAAITELARIGVPVSVLLAPVIPAINDGEIEAILAASSDAGATQAAYIFLRLPHEVRDLFVEWLETHYPDRANHVMSLIRQASGGRDYDHRFGVRQTGRGPYADMLGKRFQAACTRHGLNQGRYQKSLDCSRFDPPGQKQLGLF